MTYEDNQFLSLLENSYDPLISFKELILQISTYTNQTPSQIADKLETLLFDFRQNGAYINSFCYCTIINKTGSEREIYEPMENNFKDAFNFVKGHLKDIILRNSLDIENIDMFFVRRSEIIQRIKISKSLILNKVNSIPLQQISQIEGDYISLYALLEWAKPDYENLSKTAVDLLRLLQGRDVQLYRRYSGIKKNIDKDDTNIKELLKFVQKNNGYNEYQPEDEIPF
ncbi:hypothetical protein [Necropsobacter massiliensis]|uniref:hypothetical protein n=1 Tax=Necropsobacter massiliensis TaxID=1400001 RepID=UPI000595FA9E|nr:hypothetical protein [Necropsobacter massiliensis]